MLRITKYSFGSIEINGKSYEDIKIYKNQVLPWHYVEHHTVTLQDINDITADIEILVIGNGQSGLVKVLPEVEEFAEKKKIKLIIAETPKACEIFNDLVRKEKKVAAILHSTC